ncbi:hypothetical protein PP411_gp61 [Vibrio phage vB_VpP_BT-1011]|uniref:Uncharacterized protein n=1 Tax=Vibrio phage vB_VpP_BT-1011 TaxID=2799672 RepID=A0A8F2XXE3_9CAUD|nr:hypothetical protein PP411_gp61 [Vibrio phage vB_VpP_BT-1011]QWX10260.1 hypothetical protein vBVpPBT1011_0061 [Vibrio phage vB_VpP_BT-1011]
MTAHKHAAIIKAKADNMDLVVFVKSGSRWLECRRFPEWRQSEYFLCLPQHKEACLHWLNGGATQVKYKGDCWQDIFNDPNRTWPGISHFMMRHNVDYRIKPRKEKRWVAIDEKGRAVPTLIKDEESLQNAKELMHDCSFHEIEVEV